MLFHPGCSILCVPVLPRHKGKDKIALGILLLGLNEDFYLSTILLYIVITYFTVFQISC